MNGLTNAAKYGGGAEVELHARPGDRGGLVIEVLCAPVRGTHVHWARASLVIARLAGFQLPHRERASRHCMSC